MAHLTGGSKTTTPGVRQAVGTISGTSNKFTADFKAIELRLNDPIQAMEFFSSKRSFIVGPMELNRILQEKNSLINIIDVRQVEDYAKGHLPGAINLPKDQWQVVTGLKKDKLNIIYCYSLECPLAAAAAAVFADKGYSVMELQGGFDAWQENHLNTDLKVHH